MKFINFKKVLSMILVLVMTISVLPVQVFAWAGEKAASEDDALNGVESKPFEETLLLKQIKSDIAKYLDKYLDTLTMSEENVKKAISEMTPSAQEKAWAEAEKIVAKAEELTDAELYFLYLYEGTETFDYVYYALEDIFVGDDLSLYAVGDDFNYFDSKLTFTDTAGTASKTNETAFKASISVSAGTLII